MRRFFIVMLFPAAALALTACANPPPRGPGAAWIERYGGTCNTDVARRGEDAWNRLLGSQPGQGLSLTTLNCSTPTAFAWRDGSIFISRGLVELLDDESVAAAIAHELGHLTDHHRASASNLDGPPRPPASDLDMESRADAAGVVLLRRAGIPAVSMRRMLIAVRHSRPLSPTRDAALQRRIHQLPLD